MKKKISWIMMYVSVIRYVLNMSNQLDLPGTERKSSMHEYFSRDILIKKTRKWAYNLRLPTAESSQLCFDFCDTVYLVYHWLWL